MLRVLAVLAFFAFAAVLLFLVLRGGDGTTTAPPTATTTGGGGGKCGDRTPSFDRPPAWAQQGPVVGPTQQMYDANKRTVSAMNASGKCFDFLMFGDSITAFLTRRPEAFKKHFGDVTAATLGIGGNTVEQLAWRIMAGNERPARAPKCIAILIGVNNILLGGDFGTAARHVEELLRWLQKAYPTTKLVLLALLPASRGAGDVQGANQRLAEVARRTSVLFAECGQQLDPTNARMYSDGVHPTTAGYDVILGCLRALVDPFIRTPT